MKVVADKRHEKNIPCHRPWHATHLVIVRVSMIQRDRFTILFETKAPFLLCSNFWSVSCSKGTLHLQQALGLICFRIMHHPVWAGCDERGSRVDNESALRYRSIRKASTIHLDSDRLLLTAILQSRDMGGWAHKKNLPRKAGEITASVGYLLHFECCDAADALQIPVVG